MSRKYACTSCHMIGHNRRRCVLWVRQAAWERIVTKLDCAWAGHPDVRSAAILQLAGIGQPKDTAHLALWSGLPVAMVDRFRANLMAAGVWREGDTTTYANWHDEDCGDTDFIMTAMCAAGYLERSPDVE